MGDNAGSSGSNPVISIGNIRGFGGCDYGSFRMSNEFLGWKNKQTNSVYQYKCSDISEAEWIKTGYNNNRLHIKFNKQKDNLIIFFDGFPDRNISEITQHFQKYFNLRLASRKIATKGWNWGEFKLENTNINFDIDNKYAFSIPTNSINQLNVQIKTDIAMELKNEDYKKTNEDFLSEIRFCYPHENDENKHFQNFKNDLLEKVNIGDSKSECIASLANIPLLVPRGRYEIEMYPKSFKLHGKSYDFTVQYTNINKMLLVPKSNSNQYVLIFSLNNKMKQGQTEYPFILVQLNNDDDMELDINASEEDLKKYKLEKSLCGRAYEVIPRLFSALVKKNAIIPGDFRTAKNEHGITCSYRAASGQLYPLNKYFLFIVKPVILISFDDIVTLTFQRTGNINQHRFFSVIIKHKRGMSYEYTNIDKSEYLPLLEFLKSKNIHIQDDANVADKKQDFGDELSESDEEEYVADDDDDDEEDYVAEEEEDDDDDGSDDDEEEEEEEEEEDDDK
ncbi:FACT complex subunit SSRP1, putative [Plasmodium knowlesi strain H]|uniref:FACT complex subunit SSRP1 n=3 Tax=Plasmodium knowlesi TaxID=5850 RepID=A0A5K1UJ77_PLAKH|nr:FACT complex subunit SSRP1, putative [Plasmodium knowlesi strain H]OTN65686.1 FACT complex subunit SSRP1 [Plasmodium knowlesi]CAA9989736.1 FACT complex subunit SSRP1, putative [Plasmodium knowlesi strain H]SBO22890.1 FACT complex subunit SSRP1, putative [Plasmodium knowlesi strain H]SBO23011.1 FACT complex subunit SSRP1, putative [Plasmodium knowlesi strain H]VVS79210.1 FACT complex subunit SSRP1, putative [Plasmodium knowlesi strain H]|eukprot:XP_002260459.1 structure specific recognition protein,putative [Plasmodium knowlesi strain H]